MEIARHPIALSKLLAFCIGEFAYTREQHIDDLPRLDMPN
jgi:hypothetical protein